MLHMLQNLGIKRLGQNNDGFLTSKKLVLLLSSLCLLVACGTKEPQEDTARPVRTVLLHHQSEHDLGELSAEVKPRVESALAFQVGGRVVRRYVDIGQVVRAGQVLAELNGRDLALSLQAAKAQLDSAQAAMVEAQSKLQRSESVASEGFISPSNMESLRANAQAAQARYEQARAQWQLQSNQAQYGRLTAPNAGVVTTVNVQVGQVVGAGQTVMSLAQAGQMELAFAIPERLVQQLRPSKIGVVTFLTGQQGATNTYSAVIREVAPSADPVTRTYSARAVLQGAAPAGIHYGMTASIRFSELMAQETLRVPLESLLRKNNKNSIWVLNSKTMTVHLKEISVVDLTDTDVLFKADIPEGAEVVSAGVHHLKEGQKVKRLLGVSIVAPRSEASHTTTKQP